MSYEITIEAESTAQATVTAADNEAKVPATTRHLSVESLVH
jgi:hypothetical protein